MTSKINDFVLSKDVPKGFKELTEFFQRRNDVLLNNPERVYISRCSSLGGRRSFGRTKNEKGNDEECETGRTSSSNNKSYV